MGRRSAGAALETTVTITVDLGTDECDGPFSFFRSSKSAGRLPGISASSRGLMEAIDHLGKAIKHDLRAAEEKQKTAAALEAYASTSNNAALADVGRHQADLLRTHARITKQSAANQTRFLEELRKIKDTEDTVREAEMKVVKLQQQEAKISDSLHRGDSGFLRRRRSEGDGNAKKIQQLSEISRKVESARIKLDETWEEMEIVKMLRFRYGMQGLADEMVSYSGATAAIYGCYREITEMVPAISTQDIMVMNYDGAEITRNCVERLRRDITAKATASPPSQLMGDSCSRRAGRYRTKKRDFSPALHSPASGPGATTRTPPPPYTASAPAVKEQLATVPEAPSTPRARPTTPRTNRLYPILSPNPYRMGSAVRR